MYLVNNWLKNKTKILASNACTFLQIKKKLCQIHWYCYKYRAVFYNSIVCCNVHVAPFILIVTFLVPQYFIDILNYDFWRMQKGEFSFVFFFSMEEREETIPRMFY